MEVVRCNFSSVNFTTNAGLSQSAHILTTIFLPNSTSEGCEGPTGKRRPAPVVFNDGLSSGCNRVICHFSKASRFRWEQGYLENILVRFNEIACNQFEFWLRFHDECPFFPADVIQIAASKQRRGVNQSRLRSESLFINKQEKVRKQEKVSSSKKRCQVRMAPLFFVAHFFC